MSAPETVRAGRVLVIDDDARMVDLLCEVLRLDGHSVRGARSFDEAAAMLETEAADLVVTDLKMPGVDGASGFARLRERGLAAKAIVVSGFVDARSISALAGVGGVVGVVTKPFDVADLARRVREALAAP